LCGEQALVDELETIRDSGTGVKSLVYSQFTRYLDMVGHILRWKGFTFVRLDGRMSKAKRQRSMERFKNDPEVTIFLSSLKAVLTPHHHLERHTFLACLADWRRRRVGRVRPQPHVGLADLPARPLVERTPDHSSTNLRARSLVLTSGGGGAW
jgi:hypothetical protein